MEDSSFCQQRCTFEAVNVPGRVVLTRFYKCLTMSGRAGRRVKSWHESKHLRKRAAFLLEDPNLIPTDVCFRIRTNNRKIKVVRGHK